MRISTRDGDPGHAAWLLACARGERVKALLDGIERTWVITADEERRELLRAVTDERGHVVVNQAAGEVITETLRGEVVIVTTRAPAPATHTRGA